MWRSLTYYLAENPWYLAGPLGLVGVGFLIALRMTADGRYLKRALVALGLATAVLVVEQFWVTDAERIEKVVYDLVDAVSRSDAERTLALMDDRVTFSLRSGFGDDLDPGMIRRGLAELTFDYLRASRLTVAAGEQTRRGSAEFRLASSGTYHMTVGSRNFLANTEWSLGFRKRPTGEWKINRITAVSLPPYVNLGELLRRAGSQSWPPSRPTPAPGPPMSMPPHHPPGPPPDPAPPDGTRPYPRPRRPPQR